MIIYLITNKHNGKKYVGMTNGTAKNRFRGHCRTAAANPKVPIHLAIVKHGPGAFTIKVLTHAANRKQLCALERKLIAEFDCRVPRGYNLTSGGDGYSGAPVSKETRKLLGRQSKAAWARLTPEERTKRGRQISIAKKGMKAPWATGDKLRGRPRPQSFKKKVSAGMQRYVASLPPGEMSRRSKCRKPQTGRKLKLTPEQRQQRSKAARAGALKRYTDPEQRRLTAERTRESWKKRKRTRGCSSP